MPNHQLLSRFCSSAMMQCFRIKKPNRFKYKRAVFKKRRQEFSHQFKASRQKNSLIVTDKEPISIKKRSRRTIETAILLSFVQKTLRSSTHSCPCLIAVVNRVSEALRHQLSGSRRFKRLPEATKVTMATTLHTTFRTTLRVTLTMAPVGTQESHLKAYARRLMVQETTQD